MKNNYHLNITNEEFINTLEKYNIDISNYKIQNFNLYPNGLKFIHKENEKEIVIYDDFLLDQIQIIYVNLKMNIIHLLEDLKLLKQDFLSMKQEETKQIIFTNRIDNNHIQYVGDSKINKFESPILNEGDLYEMYDYFSNEVESLIKNKKFDIY